MSELRAKQMGQTARRDSFLVFGAPAIGEAEIAEVVATLRSGWIGTGPRANRFEAGIAAVTQAESVVAVASCTAALHLCLVAMGIGEGDEVITTPMTFAATANAVIHAGGTPVFADVDRETMLISPEAVRAAITPRTRAIIPVHFAGRACDMPALRQIADDHGLKIIHDAAHALETTVHGRHVSAWGDAACYSFYVNKNITTIEGGAVGTNIPELADRLRVLSLHGMSRDAWKRFGSSGYKHYDVVAPGFKYNLTDVQAALGIHQLADIDRRLQRREEIWRTFMTSFADAPIGLPAADDPAMRHARHLFTIMLDPAHCGKTRDEVMQALADLNIGTGVHYTPVHLHSYYRERFGFGGGEFPNAEWIGERTLSLPLTAGMTDDDVADVIAAVRASVC